MIVDIEDYYGHDKNYHSFSDQEQKEIANRIVEWYRINRRKLPWRGDQPPYSITGNVKTSAKRDTNQTTLQNFFSSKKQKNATTIINKAETSDDIPFVNEGITAYTEYVSEIMLQQTRVDTVIDKYIQWMTKFPTIESLSKATDEEVNSLWSGLGYYRRAQYLVKGARYVMEHFNGVIPSTVSEIKQIPGIGDYTAGAILSIAFNQAEPAVDGNVMRVLSRLRSVYQVKTQKSFTEWCKVVARDLVVHAPPSDYTQGIMELGAVVCTPQSPSCDSCPVKEFCKGRMLVQMSQKKANNNEMMENKNCSICCNYPLSVDSVEIYPLVANSKEVPSEYYSVLLLESKEYPGSFLLHRRTAAILTGQLEPLMVKMKVDEEEVVKDLDAVKVVQSQFAEICPSIKNDSIPFFHSTAKHVFSHRIHYLSVCSAVVSEQDFKGLDDYEWWTSKRIHDAGTTSWLLLMLKTAKRSVNEFTRVLK